MLRSFTIEAGALRPHVRRHGLLRLPADGGLGRSGWRRPPEEERALEQALGIDIPTRAEAGGIQISDRLVVRDGDALHECPRADRPADRADRWYR